MKFRYPTQRPDPEKEALIDYLDSLEPWEQPDLSESRILIFESDSPVEIPKPQKLERFTQSPLPGLEQYC